MYGHLSMKLAVHTPLSVIVLSQGVSPNVTGILYHHEVKYTTRNPIQLPTTPTAEYELVNISGRNS